MNMARGNFNSDNLFREGMDAQVKFAPGTALTTSMLLAVPLSCSIDPKTGCINDNVAWIGFCQLNAMKPKPSALHSCGFKPHANSTSCQT